MHSLRYGVAALALGVALPSLATVSVRHSGSVTRYELRVEGVNQTPILVEGISFEKPVLRGVDGYTGVEYRPGRPELPALRLVVRGEGEVAVEADSKVQLIPVQERIAPSMPPVPRVPGATRHLFTASALDAADAAPPLPPARFQIDEMTPERGVRRRLVSLYPILHEEGEKSLRFVARFTVTHRHGPAAARAEWESLLLVVGKAFRTSRALKSYVDYKESLGFEVETFVVEDAAPKPEAIRKRIQEWYREQAGARSYVLIVGDHEDVPGYTSEHVAGVTDHYYRALGADYERDMAAADVSLGRFSVRTEEQLEALVMKSIRYTRGQYADERWLEAASLIASDDSGWFKVAEGTLTYLLERYLKPLGYRGRFPGGVRNGGDVLYAISHQATTADVLAMMAEGRGYITYGGHGDTGSWNGPAVTNADLKALKHPEATPFVPSLACWTGHFVDDSFAEAWSREPHGAVMVWASTDLDYWDEGEMMQKLQYDNTFGGDARDFGEIADRTVNAFWAKYRGGGRSRYYWESYLSFGDPSIAFRPGPTVPVALRLVERRPLAPRALRVVDGRRGTPLADVRVAFLTATGKRIIRYTDRRGLVPIAGVLAWGERQARVVVTGRGVRQFEETVRLR